MPSVEDQLYTITKNLAAHREAVAHAPTTHDAPATVPAVVSPLTESSADVWRRWGQDRQEREIWKRVGSETHNQALTGPIYPRPRWTPKTGN